MRVLVTGASGFVGRALLDRMSRDGRFELIGSVRLEPASPASGHVSYLRTDELGSGDAWREAMLGVDVVIHTAARVHVTSDRSEDPLAAFRRTNVAGTLSVGRQAAEAGVSRFVFISSIKVHGEYTLPDRPFSVEHVPAPADPYAVSKLEAEQGLFELQRSEGLEVTVIRPPLVYGPGVKANFLTMMRWIEKGVPLPLGAVHNKRSFIALPNLVDLVVTCCDHPAAANRTFLAADREDLSTTELLRRVGVALGKPARLLPVPQSVLRWVTQLAGGADLTRRLLGSLQVDYSKTSELLGWQPEMSIDEGLRETARHYLDRLR